MKTPLLALLAAATVALAANTSTNTNKKPSGPTPPGGNKTAAAEKTATTEKKPKKDAKAEAPAAAPVAAAEPASLVVQTVDATTQMALAAAKAAQEEVAKLTAIGTGKAAGGASNAKLAEAVVGTGVVVAKELSKPKKEADEDVKSGPKKPEPKAEKKATGDKPKKATGA
jgi:hypothetical protein